MVEAGLRGESRRRARSCAALGTGAVANGHARMRSARARWNGARAGSCCATGVLPWRSGGGGTPAAVPGQQSAYGLINVAHGIADNRAVLTEI